MFLFRYIIGWEDHPIYRAPVGRRAYVNSKMSNLNLLCTVRCLFGRHSKIDRSMSALSCTRLICRMGYRIKVLMELYCQSEIGRKGEASYLSSLGPKPSGRFTPYTRLSTTWSAGFLIHVWSFQFHQFVDVTSCVVICVICQYAWCLNGNAFPVNVSWPRNFQRHGRYEPHFSDGREKARWNEESVHSIGAQWLRNSCSCHTWQP